MEVYMAKPKKQEAKKGTSKFKKAECEQAYLKVAMFGAAGSGKTFTALLYAEELARKMGKKTYLFDTENGYHFYVVDVPEREFHPTKFNINVFHTQSLAEMNEEVANLPDDCGVLIFDSLTQAWSSAKDHVPDEKKNNVGAIPLHLWGTVKKPYKELVKKLMNGQYHTFVLIREKNSFDDDGAGGLRMTGKLPQCESESPYEFNMLSHHRAVMNQKTKVTTYEVTFEKDRTGILSGKTFNNPDYKTIEPVMYLFGSKHAQLDESSVAEEKDKKHFERVDHEKATVSLEVFEALNKRIESCEKLDVLEAIYADMRKGKRKLVKKHQDSLRDYYDDKKEQLAA
jgi:hypothetical protein